MNKPIVSIIMSTYNDSSYIKESIDSVLAQTFTNWEFIIINDASTDNTDNIIKKYLKKDKRIIYLNNKQNFGQTKNLITGVNLAKGEFIARIDGDDIWIDENKLKKQIDFLKANPEYGLVGSFWITINMEGEKISQASYLIDDKEIRNYLLIENCFLHSSVVIRKSIIDKAGNYNMQSGNCAQDYDLWLRVGKISKLYNLPEFMVAYRINPKGITQTNYKSQVEEIYKITRKYKHDYPNFVKGYFLWHMRQYLPKWTRQQISKKSKLLKILTYFKYRKSNIRYE